jgi:hypothetical protein
LRRVLTCFGIACVVGSAVGIVLRVHYEAPYRSNEVTSVWHGGTQQALQLAALRTKLRMLGVSPDGQTAILTAAGRALDDDASTIPARHVKEVATQARQLPAELQALKQKAGAARATVPQDADALITQLDLFCHETEPWAEAGMPRDLYKNSVELVWFHLSRIAMPREQTTAAWIHQTGFDTKNLYAFFQSLHAEFRLRDDLDWKLGGDTAQHLDKFLEWASKATPHTESEEISPAIDMSVKDEKTPAKKGEKEK